MGVHAVLVVCVGNICRSPVAAALLQDRLPSVTVQSAGLAAVVGADVDPTARAAALAAGTSIPPHRARQFAPELGQRADLILVLEGAHKRAIVARSPALSGRVMRLGRWIGDTDIPDPFRKGRPFHDQVFRQMQKAVDGWAVRLQSQELGVGDV